MTEPSARWYVVQCRPHSETKAVAHLNRQGFETYLPRYLKRRRHARRVETLSTPLFPRYLFISIDIAAQRWRAIQSTIGVVGLVRNGNEPAVVSDTVLQNLRSREGVNGLIQLSRRPSFAPGEKIRVLEGIFAASLGLFEGLADHERVAILLDLLGRKVRVVLDGEAVAAA